MDTHTKIKSFLKIIAFGVFFLGVGTIAYEAKNYFGNKTPENEKAVAKTVQGGVEEKEIPEAQLFEMKVGSTVIPVEIEDDMEEIKRGLSGRESLDADKGMLFVFDHSARYQFWMPDMHFNIDIIWINDGKVVDVTKSASKEFDRKNPILYKPSSPAQFVLEVNEGFADAHNIKKGSIVTLPKLP